MKNSSSDVVSNSRYSVFSKPSIAIFLCILVCGCFAFGLDGLKLNASYSAYFDPEDPILREHRDLQSRFSVDDNLLIVIDYAGSKALEPAVIEHLHAMVSALQALDIVVRVSSVLDFGSSDEAEFDDLDQELFSLDNESSTSNAIPSINVQAVKDDPRGQGLLLSKDSSALILDVTLDLPEKTPAPKLLQALAVVRATVDKTIKSSPVTAKARYSGPLALNEAYISVIRHDLKVFLPALVISMMLVLTLIFGSVKLTVIALVIAILSVVSAFGFAGWLGAELAAINAFAPVMIASLSLAGAVHIFNSYFQTLVIGLAPKQALTLAVTENAFPLALTSMTTAGGFLALLYSPSPPIRTIGLIVAIGVLFSWLYIMLLLPALLGLTNARPVRAKWLTTFIEFVGDKTAQYPKQILLIVGVLGVVALPFVAQNQINDNVFEYFPSEHQFKRDLNVLNDEFSGINPQIFSVGAPDAHGAFDRKLLSRLDTFQQWLEQQPEVMKTLSITNFPQVREQLNQSNTKASSSYQELAKVHTPRALGIENLVDEDYQTLAVHAYIAPSDAKSLIDFNRRAMQRLKGEFPTHTVSSGGTSLVFAHLGQRNAASMIYALLVAILVVALICLLILNTWHGVWIGVLCNLLPLVIVYAWWALIDGSISIGGAVVIGMILGIVVDDTVYLLAKFRRAIKHGDPSPDVSTLSDVGPALVVTSVTIVVGLSAGLLSDFSPIKAMSGLSMGVVSVAMLIDLFCLTVILSWLKRRHQNQLGPYHNTKKTN